MTAWGRETMGTQCGCPICVTTRSTNAVREAIAAIDGATNHWTECGTEMEADYHFLLDEVRAAVKSKKSARRRLRKALATLDALSRTSWEGR